MKNDGVSVTRRGVVWALAGAGLAVFTGCGPRPRTGATRDSAALAEAARVLRTTGYRFVVGSGGGYFMPMVNGTYDPAHGSSVRVAAFRNESDSIGIRALAVRGTLYARVEGRQHAFSQLESDQWYRIDKALIADTAHLLPDPLVAVTAVPGDPSGAAHFLEHATDATPATDRPPPLATGFDVRLPTPAATADTHTIAAALDRTAAHQTPIMGLFPWLGGSNTPMPTATPTGPLPSTPGTPDVPYQAAAELTADNRLVRLFFWTPGNRGWAAMIITSYGDVSADLRPPDPAATRAATRDDLVNILYGLSV